MGNIFSGGNAPVLRPSNPSGGPVVTRQANSATPAGNLLPAANNGPASGQVCGHGEHDPKCPDNEACVDNTCVRMTRSFAANRAAANQERRAALNGNALTDAYLALGSSSASAPARAAVLTRTSTNENGTTTTHPAYNANFAQNGTSIFSGGQRSSFSGVSNSGYGLGASSSSLGVLQAQNQDLRARYELVLRSLGVQMTLPVPENEEMALRADNANLREKLRMANMSLGRTLM